MLAQQWLKGFNKQPKPKHNVTKITNTSISPYKGILRVGAATGFVVVKTLFQQIDMSLKMCK